MAGEPTVTIVGNTAGEPNLRYTPSGKAVLDFSVASTPRSKDRQTDQWVDGTTMWVRVKCFGKDAENAAESLGKQSARVIATGRLQIEEWEDKQGQKRTTMVLLADEVGMSMKWATVKATRAERASEAAPRLAAVPDPWAASPVEDDPPF